MTKEGKLLVDIRTDAERADEDWIAPYFPKGNPGKSTDKIKFAIRMAKAQRVRIKHYYKRMPPNAQTRAKDMLAILDNQLATLQRMQN